MPKALTYVGAHFAVDVPAIRAVDVEQGQTVKDVPDDIAKSLVESGQWKEAEAKPAPKAEQAADVPQKDGK